MKEIKVLLVGVGGYGAGITKEVLDNREKKEVRVVGVVEPFIDNSVMKEEIISNNIPVYTSMQDFYKENTADFAIISTPIYLHKEQCIYAMEQGSDVLCEKPISPTVQDAYEMRNCSLLTGRYLNIGYQLSHAPANLKLKQDILDNKFGKLIDMYSIICWPRNSTYYSRPWAAKAYYNGKTVLDSIAMNACAHYLHNMFFLAGDSLSESAQPVKMGASLYRANNIETFDTACFEVTIKDDVPLRFIATHATKNVISPVTRCRFENATLYITETVGDNTVIAEFNDGTVVEYGATYQDRFEKIWHCIDVSRGVKAQTCTVDTALPHLKCVNAATEFVDIIEFDNVMNENEVNFLPDIDVMFKKAFDNNVMPELYKPSGLIDLKSYDYFGGIKCK